MRSLSYDPYHANPPSDFPHIVVRAIAAAGGALLRRADAASMVVYYNWSVEMLLKLFMDTK